MVHNGLDSEKSGGVASKSGLLHAVSPALVTLQREPCCAAVGCKETFSCEVSCNGKTGEEKRESI